MGKTAKHFKRAPEPEPPEEMEPEQPEGLPELDQDQGETTLLPDAAEPQPPARPSLDSLPGLDDPEQPEPDGLTQPIGWPQPDEPSQTSGLPKTDEVPPLEVLSEPPEAAVKTKKRRRWPWVALIVVVVAILAVYLLGVDHFQSAFLPNTVVDGTDVSLATTEELTADVEAQADVYELTISGVGLEVTVTADDVSLSYDGETYAEAAIAQQNPWTWPVAYVTGETTQITVGQASASYDEDALVELISSAISNTGAEVTESVTYDEEDGAYAIASGAYTQYLSADAIAEAAGSAIEAGAGAVEVGDECLVGAEALQETVNTANSYLSAEVTLTLAGTTVYTIEADDIQEWITIGDDLSITLDEEAIESLCSGTIASEVDSVGTSRTFTAEDGDSVTVSGGTYGWEVDAEATAEAIVGAIESGEATELAITCSSEAATYNPGGADWGTRYIEIDLSEQHAIFYDDGEIIWESDVVTGTPNGARNTPTGVFFCKNKYQNITLYGDYDAETDTYSYESPVSYWMGFYGSGYGLHDASWRSSFGGSIWQTNGSHGCVNLPVDYAATLYDLIEIGDVVIVHD